MSNIIDSIQLSGVTYTIQGSGGGKTIEAGRGISVTTGETADTVSFNLPISAGTGTNSIAEGGTLANGSYSHAEGYGALANGNYSHAEGSFTVANGSYSHAEGYLATADGNYSHAEGYNTIANNQSEHASGQYNVSNKANNTFGNSGNTLFSVGNGTSYNSRHNVFEIRQNGDIYITSGGTDIKLQDNLGGGSITVDTALDSGSTNPVENRVIYNKFDEVEQVTAAGLNALNSAISGISGNNVVELTQAQYDALVSGGTVDPTAFYIITDATPVDMSQYWTSAQTQSAINQATAAKQDTLVSGTNIKTINNESILGSGNIDIQGGSTYTAGRGISIANDTISVSLPISAGTGTNALVIASDTYDISNKAKGNYSVCFNGGGYHPNYASGASSFAQGMDTKAYGVASHSEGCITTASGDYSHAEGYNTIANNQSEHASGRYNVSNKANNTFGNSGNTLFSVGNGTSYNAKHNAFEIRQNGDIYLSLNGQDVKLQDQLGGGTVDQTIISGSTNAVAGGAVYSKIDEVEQVTAAGLNALNDKFGGLKLVSLSQAEYNALATKDSSTLYIIVN